MRFLCLVQGKKGGAGAGKGRGKAANKALTLHEAQGLGVLRKDQGLQVRRGGQQPLF